MLLAMVKLFAPTSSLPPAATETLPEPSAELLVTLRVPTLIVVLLIAANGFFVAAEFAIVGAPRATIQRLAQAGSRSARLVRRILDDPQEVDRFIATAQLGITLASLGLGMYGEHLLAEWIGDRLAGVVDNEWVAAHTIGSVIAIAVLTYFHIVVGEMVPKSIALQKADRSILVIAPVMRVIQLLFYPLVVVLNGIGNAALRVLRIDRHQTGDMRLRDRHVAR
jgi:CBS domain containing-hemolysin-like protein